MVEILIKLNESKLNKMKKQVRIKFKTPHYKSTNQYDKIKLYS